MSTHSDPTPHASPLVRWRQRVHAVVEPAGEGDPASRVFDLLLLTLIALNVLAVVLETVEAIGDRFAMWFQWFEIFSVTIFIIEYLVRLWACRAEPGFRHPVTGRLRFAARPMLIVDLLAFLPSLLPMLGVDGRALRAIRLLRIFRILKLARYTQSLQLLTSVVRHKSSDLVVVTTALGVLLLMASSVMYFLEHEAQPEAFPSIPATMWWGVVTLSTVGYGDVYPVTAPGQLLGGLVAVLGIDLFALPAGLLAAGFTEELRRRRSGPPCPECGQPTPVERRTRRSRRGPSGPRP